MQAPIVLFLYNRPSHSEATLKNLLQAKGAENSDLFIFCDGPKTTASDKDIKNIKNVRQIAQSQKGFRSVTVTIADQNKGLGYSIIDGVADVVNKFGKCIVLEDDHLVHVDFLKYMNHYLNVFENEKRVMHVSGFLRDSYLQFVMPSAFCTRYMDCGGWGTWSDRWAKLDLDLEAVDKYLEDKENLKRFNFSKLDYHTYFDQNRGEVKTWAIFWYYTIAINKGLCVMSNFSYVKNIGNDGSGSNEVVKSPELASNFIKKFKPYLPKLHETTLSELYIQDAYAKRSQKRFTTPKKWIHDALSKLRNAILKPEI